MNARRLFVLATLLFGASLLVSGCGLLEIFAGAFGGLCERPLAVTTYEDKNDGACTPDDCSLREAVITANQCEGENTIVLSPGTYELELGLVDEGADGLDPDYNDLDIRGMTRIEGNGAVIDANSIDRVITYLPKDEGIAAPSLTLDHLTVEGGYTSGDGGGIYSPDGDWVILDSSFVRDNEAEGAGGGLYGGQITLSSSEILDNQSGQDGGGLYKQESGQIFGESGLIAGNQAGMSGGGAYVKGLTSWSERIEFANNSSEYAGGGLYSRGRLRIASAVFEGNSANQAGGGLYSDGVTDVDLASFIGNDAQIGGGAWHAGERITVENSTFTGNDISRGEVGGAAFFHDGGTANLINVTVSGNVGAGSRSAAVWTLEGRFNINHVTLANNEKVGFAVHSVYGGGDISNSIILKQGGSSCGLHTTSAGYNLFLDDKCDPLPSDVILASEAEALIDALDSNGGLTQTHALLEGSPAVDLAEDGCPPPTVDQRGIPRPVGEACDSGAYEGMEETETRSVGIDVNFNADRYSIEKGECTTLRWAVTGADIITLLGTEREATEAQEVCPDDTTGYTLIAENAADQIQSFLEIEVTEPTFSGGADQSCLHQGPNDNQPICYEVCPVDAPNPGGTCTP